jgi:hypothetical protein
MSTADREQAHYFDELLAGLQAEVDQRIEDLYAKGFKLERTGGEAALGHTRRTIRALEKDVRTMQRMREALRLRLVSAEARPA